jgi:hypothetical protein
LRDPVCLPSTLAPGRTQRWGFVDFWKTYQLARSIFIPHHFGPSKQLLRDVALQFIQEIDQGSLPACLLVVIAQENTII